MINDWGLLYNTTYPVAKSKQRLNEKESFAVKLCPKCNNAYELIHDQYRKTIHTYYIEDFPKRGLYNLACFKCQ